MNHELRKSKNKYLLERTDRDNFWGDGKNHDGGNNLGKLLMDLRNKKINDNFNYNVYPVSGIAMVVSRYMENDYLNMIYYVINHIQGVIRVHYLE